MLVIRSIKFTPVDEDCVVVAVTIEAEVKRVMLNAIGAFPVTANMIQDATVSDYELRQAKKCLHDGWPNKVDNDLIGYFRRRYALSITN